MSILGKHHINVSLAHRVSKRSLSWASLVRIRSAVLNCYSVFCFCPLLSALCPWRSRVSSACTLYPVLLLRGLYHPGYKFLEALFSFSYVLPILLWVFFFCSLPFFIPITAFSYQLLFLSFRTFSLFCVQSIFSELTVLCPFGLFVPWTLDTQP